MLVAVDIPGFIISEVQHQIICRKNLLGLSLLLRVVVGLLRQLIIDHVAQFLGLFYQVVVLEFYLRIELQLQNPYGVRNGGGRLYPGLARQPC